MRQSLLLYAFGLALLAPAVGAGRDDQADAILKKVETATQALKSLTADLTMTQQSDGQTTKTEGRVMLKKPNLARIEFGPPYDYTIASDGRAVWLFEKRNNRYQKSAADPQGGNLASFLDVPVGIFFDPHFTGWIKPTISETKYLGTVTVEGLEYRVMEVHGTTPYPFTLKSFIDSNNLITRTEMKVTMTEKEVLFTASLSHIQLNSPLAENAFDYKPPATATLYDLSSPDHKLLPVGSTAPRFSLDTPEGKAITLDQLLARHKAVLINFWFCGCEPCRQEFPALERLYTDLRNLGLGMVAVNYGDASDTVRRFSAKNGLHFPIALGGNARPGQQSIFTRYGVLGYPTTYVLDSKGNVVWRGVGIHVAEARAALSRLGVK